MVRSNWKLPYINLFILRQFLYNEDFYDTISYIWKASGRVFFALINKEFLLNRGNSFSKFDIKQPMFNTNLGEYIISKNMGLSIHERNKKKLKKKKSSKKKKGVLANPLGYRLDLNGNWQDSWSLNTLTYTEFLHSSLKIRKFIISFFEFEKFWKTGILLNNIKIINAQKIMKIYITWYAGKSFDKKKYHFIQWYKRHIFKLIFYFRTWQTRLYWLRYKFNNIERNISNKISKCNYSLIYYNFKKKLNNDKYKKTKLLKLKYTKKGNEIISNLFSNLGSKLKTKLESLLNILISKEKTGAYKLNKKLESNEKKILKYNLRQKKKNMQIFHLLNKYL